MSAQRLHRVAWLPGDGVGPEVMAAARLVLDRLNVPLELIPGEIGWLCWCREGDALPARTLRLLDETDCALLGAITSKPAEDAQRELRPELRGGGYVYESPIVRLRQTLMLHTNLRPCKAIPGNPRNARDDIDITVFRENTEGLYVGLEWHPLPQAVRDAMSRHGPRMARFEAQSNDDLAVSVRLMSRSACRRIARRAFEYAAQRGFSAVTVVDKPNVLRATGGLMLAECRRVAAEFSTIELQERNIDAMCMWLIKNPQDYRVIVAENLFGDILSDLAAELTGGMGVAASANLGDDYALFEPIHGSAPKYAGRDLVNPLAMLMAVKLMLEWLGELEAAVALAGAVETVVAEGRVRSRDMGGASSTTELAAAVAEALSSILHPIRDSGSDSGDFAASPSPNRCST